MEKGTKHKSIRVLRLALVLSMAVVAVSSLIFLAQRMAMDVYAAPIEPPEGYPKLSQSSMSVNPTLAGTTGETLEYVIEIVNTGAYQADGVSLLDEIPANTAYVGGSAVASSGPNPVVAGGVLSWSGNVGFDSSVTITFSVKVTQDFSGIIENSAEINHPMIAQPVTLSAETVVTDDPLLAIRKTSTPAKPGPGKPLTYLLEVTNLGQPTASNLELTVTDQVPANTTFKQADPDGNQSDNLVTWVREVSLDTGATSVFTFSVNVKSGVPSGTVITNDNYQVSPFGVAPGEAYTVTVINPDLYIAKVADPEPPGSNREMTYTLMVLNKGSLATGLEVRDVIPAGVNYRRGGSRSGNEVTWNLPSLETDEWAEFEFTVFVPDIAEVPIVNSDYSVCSTEGVCAYGDAHISTVQGPTFEVEAFVDPIAKKPGGGNSPVTPTLVIHNLGPGNAIDATAMMSFERISVSLNDLAQDPPGAGMFYDYVKPGEKLVHVKWMGDIDYGETITITTIEGQNSIGGGEGTHYTATLVITDTLGPMVTDPITATAIGTVTHYANLIPTKSAPPVIGAGQQMTYTIEVFNSGLSTDEPPFPVLTDTVPMSTSLVSVSDGGVEQVVGDRTVISWVLPAMSTAEKLSRLFVVQVDDGLVSGTKIVNDSYGTLWYESEITDTLSNMLSIAGLPVTTTVREVGLVDSFKTVTPTLARPGEGIVLTFTVNVVNSGPVPLSGVKVYDLLPWQHSTYQRDAVTSAGNVSSDIVSINWTGGVQPYTSEQITFTVMVDEDYEGPITNTARITHSSLLEPVEVQAVAYITNRPVLRISKQAAPDPVRVGGELQYTINVTNLGQQATNLIITDTIPANTEYVEGSVSGAGQRLGEVVQWKLPVLAPTQSQQYSFRVRVNALNVDEIVNEHYAVTCAEGVSAVGEPLITKVRAYRIDLPAIFRMPAAR